MIIQHVVPLNDLRKHLIETATCAGPNGWGSVVIGCKCECGTRMETTNSGGIVIVHASFDGREAEEWAKDLLGQRMPADHPKWELFPEEA